MGNQNCCQVNQPSQPPIENGKNRRTWGRNTKMGWVPLDEILITDTDHELQINPDTFREDKALHPVKKKYLRIKSLSQRKTELEFEENEVNKQEKEREEKKEESNFFSFLNNFNNIYGNDIEDKSKIESILALDEQDNI